MKRSLVPWAAGFPNSWLDFRREMENLLTREGEGGNGGWLTEFAPRTDVAETETSYEVTAELPGLAAENINVELHGDVLSIFGERKEETEKKEKTFHRIERRYGTFRRSVTLPEAGAADGVTAAYKDGVLSVVVPKAKPTRATKVKVTG